MKSKKTMLLTGVLCAAVGLVGYSSSNIKDSDKTDVEGTNAEVNSDATDTSISNKKDIAEEVDYIKKSGLKFDTASYKDKFSGLDIDYRWSEDEGPEYSEYNERIVIKFPIVNRGDDVFKEQLKIATKAVGGTDEEYKKIIDKIAEGISATSDMFLDIIENPKFNVEIKLEDVERDYGTMIVSFESKNKTNYAADSNLSFQEAFYFDKETKLRIEQFSWGSYMNIDLSVPVKNVTNPKFKEQIEVAVKSIGGSDKDIEQIYSKLKGSYSWSFDEVIEENDSYSIEMWLDDDSDDEKCVYVQLRVG